MSRVMWDSTNPGLIPATVDLAAGYVCGPQQWPARAWQRFAPDKRVGICIDSHHDHGDVLDVEPRDAPPEHAPAWVRRRQASGYWRPTIYTSRSQVPAVRAACLGLDYDLWVADWTGRPHSCGLAEVAVQWTDHGPRGENVDQSVVWDDGWPYREDPNMPLAPQDVQRIADAVTAQVTAWADQKINETDRKVDDLAAVVERVRAKLDA